MLESNWFGRENTGGRSFRPPVRFEINRPVARAAYGSAIACRVIAPLAD